MFFPLGCEYVLYSLCINIFTLVTLLFYYGEHWITPSPYLLQEYDYIIVGSGTAGSLIAHRLATQTGHSHVVLEAGSHGNFLTDVPVLGPLLQGSVYDWGYETVPQEHACLSMKGKKCKWPRGKIVGGSAILNNMVHLRGNLSHYTDWFDSRHSLEYIKSHFRYIESHILPIADVKYNSHLTDAILEAALEMGYDVNDINADFDLGFMKSPVNQRSGSRWSTSHTLLNYKHNVISNTVVDKVLINEQKQAYGILCNKNDVSQTVLARKGVVLAAGTINTAKLLMLSGIGPEQHLKDLGINVVKDSPVGKNLQDHISTGLDLVLFNQSLNLGASDMLNPSHAFSYFFHGKGPFTSPGCEVVGILSTNKTKSADLQFMVLPVGVTSDRGVHLKDAVGIVDEVWEKYFSKIVDRQTASILPILLHPRSNGEITLRSKNPEDKPLINPRYLTDSQDLEIMVKGLQLLEQFVNTKAMKELGAHLNPQPYPNCEHLNIFSKVYWECYVQQLTLTSFHPVGTCKMGPVSCPESVVDTDFKVIGATRLYVADGSVLPALPSSNINAAIALMANIFFETHFLHSDNLGKPRVCNKIDRFYNFYFRICRC